MRLIFGLCKHETIDDVFQHQAGGYANAMPETLVWIWRKFFPAFCVVEAAPEEVDYMTARTEDRLASVGKGEVVYVGESLDEAMACLVLT